MAERITNFLKYGASPSLVKSVSHSEADDFIPSLVLAATDDPSIAPFLLFPLVSNPRTPKAMAYASLDYDEVRRLLLSEEMQEAENTNLSGPRQDEESNQDWWQRDWGLLNRHYSVDECLTFEAADEINRAKIAINSLRKSASEFYTRLNLGTDAESWWIQKCKVEGSIWSNEAFISDILSLLPIAVSRCPDLLEPDILVKGLLTAKWGATLLVTTLINNPFIQQTTVLLLADFLSRFLKKNDRNPLYPDVCSFSENTASYQASKDASQHKINSPVSHCIQQACWVFVLLCQSVPQLAFTCREALVKRCTFADMVIHITVELLHDELEFVSRLIFSNKKTSEWILYSMSLASKEPMSFLPKLQQTKNFSNQLKEYFGSPAVPASVKDMEGAVQHVRRALITDAEVAFNEQGWRGRLHGHLRLYCVLTCAGHLQPTHEEVNFWLHALGGKSSSLVDVAVDHPRTVVTLSTLQLGIAFLCLVPGLLSPSTKGLYYGCISSLLRPVFSHLASSNPGTEVGVWLIVQLLLRRYPDIAMFVRGAIGMDVAVKNTSIMDLCDAAGGSGIICDPSSVAKAAASLRPQGPINSTEKNADLLLKSLSQLMLSGHFMRCAVDICEVVMHCISSSTEPLHPTLVQLVRKFAEMTSLSPWGEDSLQEFRMRPLPCSFLDAAIKPVSSRGMITEKERKRNTTDYYDDFHRRYGFDGLKAESMAPAALTTFYILCREQVLQNAGIYFGYLYSGSDPLRLDDSEDIQWPKLLATLPLRSLLLYMEDHWLAYEHLFPQWLSLAAHMFPEQLLVPKLLQDSEESDKRTELSIEGVPVVEDLEWVGGLQVILPSVDANENKANHCDSQRFFSVDTFCKVFRNALAEPLLALRALKVIQVEAVENKFDVQSAVINDLVPMLLEDSCARPLQKCFCDWWQGLPHAEMELLVPQFFSSIKISSMDVDADNSCNLQKLKTSLVNFNLSSFFTSYAELSQEPLALLACKNEVYRTPLLSVFLDLLMELLVKNRRICLAGVSQGGRNGLKQEEIMGALVAQESAVCQILLEACLENPSARDDVQPGPMLEARQLICAFISSLLDTTPILLKLLHFQGYDTQLLPMLIDGVLVMVRCFEFVQELLQKSQESHIVFAVALISNLVRKYPNHPQSLETAQQVVVHVKSLRINATCSADVLRETLKPAAWCAVTFPSLALEVTALLQSCLQPAHPLEQSGTAIDQPLHDAAVAAFRLFIQQKVLPGRVFS